MKQNLSGVNTELLWMVSTLEELAVNEQNTTRRAAYIKAAGIVSTCRGELSVAEDFAKKPSTELSDCAQVGIGATNRLIPELSGVLGEDGMNVLKTKLAASDHGKGVMELIAKAPDIFSDLRSKFEAIERPLIPLPGS